MSKNQNETLIELPRLNPDVVRSNSDWSETDLYWVIDRRPVVGEYYINIYVTEKERSIQKHNTVRQLRNHQKDYRFKYCWTVIRTTNLKYSQLINLTK